LTPVILTAAQKREWPVTDYVLQTAAFARPKWEARDFRELLFGSKPDEAIARKRDPFYIALYQGPQGTSNRVARPAGTP
jgi:hypothetical protein